MSPAQLRRHLERAGISQLEAARRLRVNPRTIRRWIAGDSPIPEAVALLVPLWRPRRSSKKTT